MKLTPRYQLTVFAPRSVDPAELTPLTPRAGSAHSDPFVVTTVQGIAGTKPYLDWARGRSASIDPLTKKRTIGRQTFRVLDKRTGTDNLTRWVTAFLGDAKGANQLAGCRVEVKEWDGAAYQPWYSGRIETDQLNGALWFELVVDDRSADLEVPVFVGAPHAAVAGYAHQAPLLPLGLLKPYSTFPVTVPVRGTVTEHFNTAALTGFRVEADHSHGDQNRLLVTEQLFALANEARKANWQKPTLRGDVTPVGGALHTWAKADVFTFTDDLRAKRFFFGPGAGDVTPFPAIGTQVDIALYATDAVVSANVPLLVNDVHPITFLRHLAAGYYGRLRADGAPIWTVAIHPASVDALEADATLVPHRDIYTATATFAKVLEQVCRERNLAYDLNAAGELELIDLRRSSSAGIVGTLTDAERVLEAGVPAWSHTKKGAIALARATYHLEQRVEDDALPRHSGKTRPDMASTRITSRAIDAAIVYDQGARDSFAKPKEEVIAATGLRFRGDDQERLGNELRDVVLRAQLETLLQDLQGPFSRGPAYLDVVCRAASATVAQVRPGGRWILELDAAPDPATNLRGGPRLGLCLSRAHEGLQVKLRFLDLGESTVAVAPTVGTPTKTAGDTTNSIDCLVTLNAAAAPVRVDVAVTAVAVGVRPAEGDAAWRQAALVTATGTLRVPALAAGQRVWVRTRSEPQSANGLQIASGWVFPAGVGSVDLDALVAPNTVTVTTPSTDATVVSWVNASTTLPVEILLVAGLAPATWLPAHRIALVDPASTSYPVGRDVALTAGAQYTVGVRHIDAVGCGSPVAAVTFVAGAIGVLATPVNGHAFAGGAGLACGLAVEATTFPSTIEFRVRTETAQASGLYGDWTTFAAVKAVDGDWTVGALVPPYDRRRLEFAARTTGENASPSAWTAGIVVSHWTPLPLPPFAEAVAVPTAVLEETASSDTQVTLAGSGTGGATEYEQVNWRDALDAVPAWTNVWTALPMAGLVVTRHPRRTKIVRFRVRDAAGRISDPVELQVPSTIAFLNDAGATKRGHAYDDGGYAVQASGTDGLTTGSSVKDARNALLNLHFRYGVDGPGGVIETATQKFVDGGALDATRRPIYVYDTGRAAFVAGGDLETGRRRAVGTIGDETGGLLAAAKDSRLAVLNAHFRYAVDNAAGVVETAGQTFVDSAYLNARRPAGLWDSTLNEAPTAYAINIGRRRAVGAIGDEAGGLLAAAKDSRAAVLNLHFRYAVDGPAGVVETAGQKFVHGDALDGARKVRVVTTTDGGIGTAFGQRGANSPPSAYLIGMTQEFKERAAIGAPGTDTYGVLVTEKTYVDASGGSATQTFKAGGGVWKREGPNGGTLSSDWGPWRYVFESNTQRVDRTTGHLDSTMQDSRAAALNAHFRYAVDGPGGVIETATQKFVDGAYLDGSRRITQVLDSPNGVVRTGQALNDAYQRTVATIDGGYAGGLLAVAKDSRAAVLNLHFRYAVDTTLGVVDGTGFPLAGGQRGYLGLSSAGDVARNLPSTIKQSSASSPKVLAKGRVTGTCRHGVLVAFPSGFFQNPPMVIFGAAMTQEPRAKWGTLGDGTETGAVDATKPQYPEAVASNLGTGGFTPQLRLRQKASSQTPQSSNFGASNSLTASGHSTSATLAAGPSPTNQYTAHYSIVITANAGSGDISVTVAIDTNDGGGWAERAALTYGLACDPGGAVTDTRSHEEVIVTAAAMNSGDFIRLRIKALTTTGAGGSVTVHGFDGTSDPSSGVTFITAADSFASRTPDADDVVTYDAIEVS